LQYATKTSALLAIALLIAAPAANAQEAGQISLEGHAGVGIPAGQMWDLTDPSGSFGGTLAWHFHPNWALRGDFDAILLNDGKDEFDVILSPPMDLIYFGGGFEVNFGRPIWQDVPFTFSVNVGAGVMSMNVDETFDAGHPAAAFDERYFTLNGGARLGYQVSNRLNIFAQGQSYLIIADENDTQVFMDPVAGIEPFDTAWVVPVTAGVRLTFGPF
jgi:hypothetical protein